MSTTAFPATVTGTYVIDPSHSRIAFIARHAMISKVRGSFMDFAGDGHFDADDPSRSSLQLTIQAASIDTGSADRDNHLRSNDFFDMENYPEITFASTEIEKTGDSDFRVAGDLTIKDVTNPVSIDFSYEGNATDPFGNERIGLEGTTTVNRKDYGIVWNAPLEAGGVLVGDKVTLQFDVSAIRSAE